MSADASPPASASAGPSAIEAGRCDGGASSAPGGRVSEHPTVHGLRYFVGLLALSIKRRHHPMIVYRQGPSNFVHLSSAIAHMRRFDSPPDEHRAEPAAEAKPKPEARPKAQLIISVKNQQENEDILQRLRNPPGKPPKRARTSPDPESQPAPAPGLR